MRQVAIDLVEQLNKLDYDDIRRGIPKRLVQIAAENNLVIIYGASDDLLEFEGAISDELGAYDGTAAWIKDGEVLSERCEGCDRCPLYRKEKAAALKIEAKFDHLGYTWYIEVPGDQDNALPFVISEAGEPYCRGIVLQMKEEE